MRLEAVAPARAALILRDAYRDRLLGRLAGAQSTTGD